MPRVLCMGKLNELARAGLSKKKKKVTSTTEDMGTPTIHAVPQADHGAEGG